MFSRWIAIWVLALGITARADDVSLIGVGDVWRWHAGITQPSHPPEAWKAIEFDDAGWGAGRSGFNAGYSVYGEASNLSPFLQGAPSLYLRRAFSVVDPAAVHSLVLRIHYEHGFVAYLNGVEVARRGLTGEAGTLVPSDTLAVAHNRPPVEEIDISAHAAQLVAGLNVFALQVHRSGSTSSRLMVLPELLANFTRGPIVQNTSSESVQLIWKTLEPADSRVELGTDPDRLESVLSAEASVTNHVVTANGLTPDTQYFYRVSSLLPDGLAESPVESFRTLATEGPIRFCVLGDSGYGGVQQYEIARAIENSRPDLVLHAGDVIYPSFTFDWADSRCLSVYRSHMKSTPYFFAIGNHDLYSGEAPYLETFYLPTNSVTGTEHYYSFDHGDAHFAALFVPYLSQHTPQVGDQQHQWLAEDLAASERPWKFLILHHPLNTSGLHRADDGNLNGVLDRSEVTEVFLPLAVEHGVQAIFTSHDHNFERFAPTNGVHLIVTGGGGVPLYPLRERDPASVQFWMRYHFARVDLTGDSLRVEAVATLGEVFDQFFIQKAPPAEPFFEASWNTPVFEMGEADGDGNRMGQRFSFSGPPIPAVFGQSSNIGRVFFNYDAEFLYIGLEQCLLRPDQDVLLFLDVPGSTGVSSMSGIGDGLTGSGDGADALDFVENLSFRSFAPDIALILGDEFADETDPFFQRPGAERPLGQGIFRLTSGLPPVAGARLQQFNHSPQVEPVPDEQNANFVQIAIPMAALGLKPQDTIFAGAVVTEGPAYLAEQRRSVDSGFLGRGLKGAGVGMAELEGLEIRLAPVPDSDGDTLTDAEEWSLGTDPRNTDSDGDHLPDGWEVGSGLDPLQPGGADGADGDKDEDQLSNFGEFLAGTDPRDPNSVLRLSVEEQGEILRIVWDQVQGRLYRLLSAPSPYGEFAPMLDAGLAGENGPTEVEIDLSQRDSRSKFFRLEADRESGR